MALRRWEKAGKHQASYESSTTALAPSELLVCKEEMVTAKLGQICCSGLCKITKAKLAVHRIRGHTKPHETIYSIPRQAEA